MWQCNLLCTIIIVLYYIIISILYFYTTILPTQRIGNSKLLKPFDTNWRVFNTRIQEFSHLERNPRNIVNNRRAGMKRIGKVGVGEWRGRPIWRYKCKDPQDSNFDVSEGDTLAHDMFSILFVLRNCRTFVRFVFHRISIRVSPYIFRSFRLFTVSYIFDSK